MSHSVHIGWSDINASHIPNKYKIYRSDTPIDIENLPEPLVTDLPKEQLSYIDDTVEFGNTYYYIVSTYTSDNEELGGEQIVHVKENIYYTNNRTLYKVGYNSTTTRPKFVKGFSAQIRAIDCDVHGYVYVLTTRTLYKLDHNGNEVLSINIGENAYSIIVDAEQNAFIGMLQKVRKYNTVSEELVWESSQLNDTDNNGIANAGRVYDMSIDQQGRIWIQTSYQDNYHGINALRLDNDGSILWSRSIQTGSTYYPMGIVVDSNLTGYVLYCRDTNTTDSDNFFEIRKISDIGGTISTTRIDDGFLRHRSDYARNNNGQLRYDSISDKVIAKSAIQVHSLSIDGGNTSTRLFNIGSNTSAEEIYVDSRGEIIGITGTVLERWVNDSRVYRRSYTGVDSSISRLCVEPGKYAIERGIYTPPDL